MIGLNFLNTSYSIKSRIIYGGGIASVFGKNRGNRTRSGEDCMRKLIAIVLLVLTLAGCAARDAGENDAALPAARFKALETPELISPELPARPEASNAPPPTPTLSSKAGEAESALQAYRAVLLGEATFYDYRDKRDSAPSPTPASLDYDPAIFVTPYSSKSENAVISVCEERYSGDSTRDVLIWTNEPITHMLITRTYTDDVDDPPYMERYGLRYLPELSAGQAVRMKGYGYPDEYGETIRVAYTNGSGEYEAVLLLYDEIKDAVEPLPTEPNLLPKQDEVQDSEFLSTTSEFKAKQRAGVFDAFIPHGFCIAHGSLGDVNGDGIGDALIELQTGGTTYDYGYGPMPVFVLLGQQKGGYALSYIAPEALATPYRSSYYAEAGEGYIDIIFDEVDGAGSMPITITRFLYDSDAQDWLLNEFSYCEGYHYTRDDLHKDYRLPYEPVSPLASFEGLPLSEFQGWEPYKMPDFKTFDALETLRNPAYDVYHRVFTIAVNENKAAGLYEGYLYCYYENQGDSLEDSHLIQTFRGELKTGERLRVVVDEEKLSFAVQGDEWLPLDDVFHCAKYSTPMG